MKNAKDCGSLTLAHTDSAIPGDSVTSFYASSCCSILAREEDLVRILLVTIQQEEVSRRIWGEGFLAPTICVRLTSDEQAGKHPPDAPVRAAGRCGGHVQNAAWLSWRAPRHADPQKKRGRASPDVPARLPVVLGLRALPQDANTRRSRACISRSHGPTTTPTSPTSVSS